ncbi:hypothetical protein Tco_0009989 [Tanacetum coccineum]
MALKERTVELDEGQAGSDPGKTPESRPLPKLKLKEEDQAESNPGQSHVAQAGPNPEHMHEDFIATVYPDVHENLKLTTEEQVHIESPPSSSETFSSMKNLEDAFTFGDQFLNEKSMEEEPRKANVETKVKSMVTVPIHQASSSVPPLYQEYDLAPLKLVFEFSINKVWKSVRYGISKELDTAYWGFLGVGTTFDIFQNIHILYLQYGVLTSSGYGVLSFTPLWFLVNAGTDTPYLP